MQSGCGLRVLRGGAPRIWSGPEGSSHKRSVSGAAVKPGGRTDSVLFRRTFGPLRRTPG